MGRSADFCGGHVVQGGLCLVPVHDLRLLIRLIEGKILNEVMPRSLHFLEQFSCSMISDIEIGPVFFLH